MNVTLIKTNSAKHTIVDLYECDFDSINSKNFVETSLLEAVKISECKILKKYFHKFSPCGVTGFVCVSESHFSIHTWPENNYAAIDIFCCKGEVEKSIDYLIKAFKCKNKKIKTIKRCKIDGK